MGEPRGREEKRLRGKGEENLGEKIGLRTKGAEKLGEGVGKVFRVKGKGELGEKPWGLRTEGRQERKTKEIWQTGRKIRSAGQGKGTREGREQETRGRVDEVRGRTSAENVDGLHKAIRDMLLQCVNWCPFCSWD